MTLYYHKDNYEIKDLSDDLVNGWIQNNNPKNLLRPEDGTTKAKAQSSLPVVGYVPRL